MPDETTEETKLKTFTVAIPITGVIYVTVEAENKADAIDKAWESEDLKLKNCEEWHAHDYIVRGNVFSGTLNEINATED